MLNNTYIFEAEYLLKFRLVNVLIASQHVLDPVLDPSIVLLAVVALPVCRQQL
jgi:hypothetical protein